MQLQYITEQTNTNNQPEQSLVIKV